MGYKETEVRPLGVAHCMYAQCCQHDYILPQKMCGVIKLGRKQMLVEITAFGNQQHLGLVRLISFQHGTRIGEKTEGRHSGGFKVGFCHTGLQGQTHC